MAASLRLYPTNTATSSPAPTTSYELSTTANASEQQINPGEFDNTLPGNTHAAQWLPADNVASTTLATEITSTSATSVIRGSTVPTQTAAPTSPAGTQIGDMVIVATWSPAAAGIPTHTLQSGFTILRDHSHDDGSTDGRLTVAYQIATSAGANTYTAFASSGTPWSGIIVLRAGEFDTDIITRLWRTSAVGSVTLTSNGASNPASVTLTAGYHAHLVLAFVAYNITTATVTIGAPTGYTEEWEVAGSAATEFELSTRTLVGRAGLSEDPGTVTDDVTPNGTCSITIAIPLTPTSQQSTSVKAFLYDVDLSGQTIALGNWGSQLRLEATQGTGSTGRTCLRASIVEQSGGAWVYKDVLTGPTSLTGASVGGIALGQVGWRDQTEARHTVTSTPTNFTSTYSAIKQRKLASGEYLLLEVGMCDADSTTDRTWRLYFNTSNSYIDTPLIGVAPEVTDVDPPSGHLYGGKLIEITGTGFASGDTVSIDGRSCTSVTIHSSTRITCRTPMGIRLGARTVKVTSTDGIYGELASAFTYTHPVYDVLTTRWMRLFIVAISTGGTLTWYDAVNNGDVVQSTAANLPTVSSISASGQTLVVFDGAASPNVDTCACTTGLAFLKEWASTDHVLRMTGLACDTVPNQPGIPISVNSGGGINEDCAQCTNAAGPNTFFSGGTARSNTATPIDDGVLRRWVELNAGGTTTVYNANTAQTTTDASGTLGTNWRASGIEYGNQPASPDRRFDGHISISGWAYSTSTFSSDLAALETAFAEAHNGYGTPTCTDCDAATGIAGDVVELTGTNFEDGLTVRFGTAGNFSDEVFVVSKTQAFALVPAGSGLVNIVVANPVAGNSGTLTNGFTYDAEDVEGTASMVLAMTVAASGTERESGTAAMVVANAIAAANGVERFSGPADMVVGPAVFAATGEEEMRGTGAMVVAPPLVDAAGAEEIPGTAAMVVALVVDAAGTAAAPVTGTAELAVPPPIVNASAEEEMRGTAALEVSPPAVNASAEEEMRGPAALVVAPPLVNATAEEEMRGPATMVVAPPLVDASGAERYPGTAALVVAPPLVNASGAERFSGAASMVVAPPLCSGNALERMSGACSQVLTQCIIAAEGSSAAGNAVTGDATMVLALSIAAAGAEEFAAVAAMVVAPPAVAASGTERCSGTASFLVAPPVVAATGEEEMRGAASLVLAIAVSASGVTTLQGISGAASMVVAVPLVNAAAFERVSGTAALTHALITSTAGAERFRGPASMAVVLPVVSSSGSLAVRGIGAMVVRIPISAIGFNDSIQPVDGVGSFILPVPRMAAIGVVTNPAVVTYATMRWQVAELIVIKLENGPLLTTTETHGPMIVGEAKREPMGTLYAGATSNFTIAFRVDGDLVDPDEVTFSTRPEDSEDSPTVYTYGTDSEITRISLGRYRAAIVVGAAGEYDGQWESTGDEGVGVQPFKYTVFARTI